MSEPPHQPAPPAGITLSAASAEALEFPSLLAVVAELAATDLGRDRLQALQPYAEREDLARHRQRYEEADRLVAAHPLVTLAEGLFSRLLAALARTGHDFTGRELVAFGDLLRISTGARRRITEADPPYPALGALASALPDASALLDKLDRTLDPRGEIREDATPTLARLRGRIRTVRQRIYDNLSKHVETHREHLSEETIPMRGGRLVLMLQAGARGRIPGLVHGRSGSGRSFYFEPLDTVETNNQLQQDTEEEEAERRRILAELIGMLRAALPTLRAHADFVAELDLLQAAARFREKCDGNLAELAPSGELILVQARHPLLDPGLAALRRDALGTAGHQEAVVPLDLSLTAEQHALVVTGPNAGGKTVALKTTGLLALAHQCGLPVPAAKGTRLPVFGGVVATVGDEQDLLADRSTFSGRLLRLQEAWEAAGPDTLILIDELGSGTDPEEGAALAIALLEGLLARRSVTLITTHLSQLAAAALEMKGARCAAMQFDRHHGHPTYRLAPGPPGGSEALALARRLGLPAAWLDRAEAHLGSEHRDLRRLLAEVERSRAEIEASREELTREVADAAKLRRRLAAEEEALQAERKSVGRTLGAELERFRRETRDRLQREVAQLREEMEAGRRKGLAGKALKRLFAEAPRLAEEPAAAGPPTVGGTVRHRSLGWEGKLEKVDRQEAQVRVQGKLVRCPLDALEALAASAEPARPRRVRAPAPASDLEEASRELNLIGERVEPALARLERFLDQALLASHGEVRIIHGHGTGRLRNAVRKRLSGHRAVSSHRPGGPREGGDGATVALLGES